MASMFWLLATSIFLLHKLFVTVSAFTHGRPASIADFPFVVGLYNWPPILRDTSQKGFRDITFTNPFCTGTIATDRWVLTTMGCVDRPDNLLRSHPFDATRTRIVAGTAFTPYNVSTFERYEYRTGMKYTFTLPYSTKRRFAEYVRPGFNYIIAVFDLDYTEDAVAFARENKREWKDRNNQLVFRYLLDFAAIQVDRPWTFSRFIQPAIFPEMSASSAYLWWNSIARGSILPNGEYDIYAVQPCYAVGWGGRKDGTGGQMRLRYVKMSWISDENCELAYCNECSNCSRTPIRVDYRVENCWAAHTHGDACLVDEGSPLWCPWVGRRFKKRGGKYAHTGAVIGVLARVGGRDCNGREVPSLYHNVWDSYHMFDALFGISIFPGEPFIFDYPDYR